MNRLKEIASRLDEFGLDAMLITSSPGERYAVGFYGEGTVFVTRDKCYYLTDSRYIEAANRAVTGAVILQPGRAMPYKKILGDIITAHSVRKLGFEERKMTVAVHQGLVNSLDCGLLPAQRLLDTLRAVKDEGEINLMEQAQRISEQALDTILDFIKPGLSEREIAARLVYELLRLGGDGLAFQPIVVSGPNSSLPHGMPGDRTVRKGDFITLDFGCKVRGYCSDMTRTVALGYAEEDMKKVYDIVLSAQLAGIAAARAGVTGRSIDAAARSVIEKAGYGAYFGHGFGHGLGLEVHETPNANTADETVMPVGAVISAEPGIYLPGRFGVRIEDVIVLEQNGAHNLTRAPKKLIIL